MEEMGEAVLFLVTGNLKICLRVVELPEETLLLAPRARADDREVGKRRRR